MKQELKKRRLAALLFLAAAVTVYASCDHQWDAMTTAYYKCNGAETGACSYLEGSSPIGCTLKWDYNCDNTSGTYPVMTRTWTGTCSLGSVFCNGSSASGWTGPHPLQTTLSQSCP